MKLCPALLCLTAALLALTACAPADRGVDPAAVPAFVEHIPLEYATQFAVDRYEDGYLLLTVADGAKYVVVPEDKPAVNLGVDGASVVRRPCGHIYLAGSSATDLIIRLGALDRVKCCSTKAEDYAIPAARDAIDAGKIRYVGKYSAPEYETLLGARCDLAIESTMLYHVPKVREQLERLGVPVVVERSCYESSPLGRLEWVKFYAALLGAEEEADAFFAGEKEKLAKLTDRLATSDAAEPDADPNVTGAVKPKVAFFYLSTNGYVNVRKPGDYLCRIIELVGGEYAFGSAAEEDSNALSTINIDWEAFYRAAVDADLLVYNSSIDGGMNSVDDLIAKNPLFREFKAVKSGNVWRANANMYQENSRVVDLILDFDRVLNGSGPDAAANPADPAPESPESQPPRFLTKLERLRD